MRQQQLQPHDAEPRTPRSCTTGRRARGGDRASVPEVQDSSNDLEMRSPRVNLVIDRDKAAVVGLNATTIQNALYDALGPKWSSTIYGDTAQYRVLLELDPKYQEQADSLREGRVQGAERRAGAAASRSSTSRKRSARRSINHSGQLPSVSISFGLRPGVSLGAAIDARQAGRRPAAAADDHDQLRGLGQGVSGSR